MNRLGVFALTATGGLLAMGAASYVTHQKGPGKAAKKGRHAHEAPHHRRHKGLKKILPEALTNPVALTGLAGCAIMTAVLWKPCACLPGDVAVPPGTPGALPPAPSGGVPSTTESDFGPITR